MSTNERPRGPVDRVQEEYEKDRLVRLVGQRALPKLDPDDPANARYFDWLAREARAQLTVSERAKLEVAATEFADRILARVAATEIPVLQLTGVPNVERRHDAMALSTALDQAARQRMVPWLEPAVAAGAGREIWEEPCDTWIELPEQVPSGRYVALPVSGDSMVPLFHAGDLILVRLGETCQSGDVIVARHPDHGYVVKRVGRIGRAKIELTSLNSAYRPMLLRRAEVKIMGTVVVRWCEHGE